MRKRKKDEREERGGDREIKDRKRDKKERQSEIETKRDRSIHT